MGYDVDLLASSTHGTLYPGVTNGLVRRVFEPRSKVVPTITSRYGIDKPVWFEIHDDARDAIAREKPIKKWRRDWRSI